MATEVLGMQISAVGTRCKHFQYIKDDAVHNLQTSRSVCKGGSCDNCSAGMPTCAYGGLRASAGRSPSRRPVRRGTLALHTSSAEDYFLTY